MNDITFEEMCGISEAAPFGQRLEVALVNPKMFFKGLMGKKVTLYHGSPVDLKNTSAVINPSTVNVGTKLSGGRLSAYFTDQAVVAVMYAIGNLLYWKFHGDVRYTYVYEHGGIILRESDQERVTEFLKKQEVYLYEVEIPIDELGGGHFPHGSEYTTDKGFSPKSERTVIDFKEMMRRIVFVPDRDYNPLATRYFNKYKQGSGLIRRMLFHDIFNYIKKRKKLTDIYYKETGCLVDDVEYDSHLYEDIKIIKEIYKEENPTLDELLETFMQTFLKSNDPVDKTQKVISEMCVFLNESSLAFSSDPTEIYKIVDDLRHRRLVHDEGDPIDIRNIVTMMIRLKVFLPVDYIAFLCRHNRIILDVDTVTSVGKNDEMFEDFFSFEQLPEYYNLIQRVNAAPPGVLPFAEDGGGNYYCFDLRKKQGAVSLSTIKRYFAKAGNHMSEDIPIVFWDHEFPLNAEKTFENSTILICNGFSEFLKRLK